MFLYFLLALSMLGFVNFFRLKCKLPFPAAVFSVLCAVIMLGFLSGLTGWMIPAQWGSFGLGLILFAGQLFKSFRRNGLQYCHTVFWRGEYLFTGAFFAVVLLFLRKLPCELGYSDFYQAWYPQYLYMFFNGRWADGGYENYASYYCMIGNALPLWFSRITGNIATFNYMFAMILLAVSAIGVLLTNISWKRIPVLGLWFGTIALSYYIVYGPYPSIQANVNPPCGFVFIGSVLLCGILMINALFPKFISIRGLFPWLPQPQDFSCKVNWRYVVIFIFMMLLCTFTMTASENFLAYPFDALLAAFTLAPLALYVIWMDFGRIHRRGFYWLILWLAVGCQIKPTGFFFMLGVALIIFVSEIAGAIKERKLRKWYSPLIALTLFAAPLAVAGGWSVYAKYQKLNLQHSVASGWFEQTVKDFKEGISPERKKAWQAKVMYIGNLRWQMVKLPFVRKAESLVYSLCQKMGMEIHAVSPHNNKMHVSLLLFGALLVTVLCLFLRRFALGQTIAFLAAAWIFGGFIFFQQYYLGPMYFAVPGVFRYILPAVLILFAIPVLLGIRVLSRERYRKGILITAVILFILAPVGLPYARLFFTFEPVNLGLAFLGALNADQTAPKKVVFSSVRNEFGAARHTVPILLKYLGSGVPEKKVEGYVYAKGDYLMIHSGIHYPQLSYMPKIAFADGEKGNAGIYVGSCEGNKAREVLFRPVPYSQEHLDLLEKAYDLRRVPLDRFGYLSHDVNGLFEEKGKWPAKDWTVVYGGNELTHNDLTDDMVVFVRHSSSGNIFCIYNKSEKQVRVMSRKVMPAFVSDVISIKGHYRGNGTLKAVISLCRKDGDQYIPVSRIYSTVFSGNVENMTEYNVKIPVTLLPGKEIPTHYQIFFVVEKSSRIYMSDVVVYQKVNGQLLIPETAWKK
ncbi:MAG: hypothetical protein IJW05_06045 [Lentisphaeria bacterium]|nr:hypothetical protein [Lentisphaeria bacterium]